MPKKIMVIDDNEDCLDVIKEAFLYEGFEVLAETTGDHVFQRIAAFQPDLLLIDYVLAGINGGDICSQVKHNDKTCKLPVVIVSAYPRVINSLGYYECNAFIAKPFELEELTGKVHALINDAARAS